MKKSSVTDYTLDRLRAKIIKSVIASLPFVISPFFTGLITRISISLFDKFIAPELKILFQYVVDAKKLRKEKKRLEKQIKELKNVKTIEEFRRVVDSLD